MRRVSGARFDMATRTCTLPVGGYHTTLNCSLRYDSRIRCGTPHWHRTTFAPAALPAIKHARLLLIKPGGYLPSYTPPFARYDVNCCSTLQAACPPGAFATGTAHSIAVLSSVRRSWHGITVVDLAKPRGALWRPVPLQNTGRPRFHSLSSLFDRPYS